MSPEPDVDESGRRTTSSADPESFAGLVEEVQCLLGDLREVAHDQARLAVLETKQAAESLVRIIAMGLIAAGLVLSTWLALNWVAVNALAQDGLLTSNQALLAAVAANVVIVLLLIVEIRRQSRRLLFPATVNSLRPASPNAPGQKRIFR